MKSVFSVAGTSFEVILPDGGMFRDLMEIRYAPFVAEDVCPSFSLSVELTDDLKSKIPGSFVRRYGEEAPYLWLYKTETGHAIGFSNIASRPTSITFEDRLYIDSTVSQNERDCGLNNALMFQYTLYSSFRESLVTHSSAVVYKGKGYIFLGKSGTGKSTHSRLWLEHIEGVELLNDDNPVIHLETGTAWICGTPWSGKTPCYKNRRVPLGGIVRLNQAPQNHIVKLTPIKALGSLISSCSNVSWNEDSREATLQTIGRTVALCPCWEMDCLPDAAAAYMSCRAVTGE